MKTHYVQDIRKFVVFHYSHNQMKAKSIFILLFIFASGLAEAQSGWKVCNTPVLNNRVDDIFMLNPQTGYSICGDGQILKTTNGGNDWFTLVQDTAVYCRSVEFINEMKGFVGGLPNKQGSVGNRLRRTIDGGAHWTDLTSLIDARAQAGICGLSIPDSNTIYGCGNYYQDSAYIIKSTDGGNSWSFIDMKDYACNLIDMYFINKDSGFATGRGLAPMRTAVILYTTDGGTTWAYKFQNDVPTERCWKIFPSTDNIYYASIEEDDELRVPAIAKSTDGGMTWSRIQVSDQWYSNHLQGVGFIDSLHGWTGGNFTTTFETKNGGITWDSTHICTAFDRAFKVNDTLLFATGFQIWKYNPASVVTNTRVETPVRYVFMACTPNPVKGTLTINATLLHDTHALITLLDNTGKEVKVIENAIKPKGDLHYHLNTNDLPAGIYYVVLKTHDDKAVQRIVVTK